MCKRRTAERKKTESQVHWRKGSTEVIGHQGSSSAGHGCPSGDPTLPKSTKLLLLREVTQDGPPLPKLDDDGPAASLRSVPGWLMEDTNLSAICAKLVTIMPKHIQLALWLRSVENVSELRERCQIKRNGPFQGHQNIHKSLS